MSPCALQWAVERVLHSIEAKNQALTASENLFQIDFERLNEEDNPDASPGWLQVLHDALGPPFFPISNASHELKLNQYRIQYQVNQSLSIGPNTD